MEIKNIAAMIVMEIEERLTKDNPTFTFTAEDITRVVKNRFGKEGITSAVIKEVINQLCVGVYKAQEFYTVTFF